MEINEATKSAYLSTLSRAKAEEFKKLSPEEQRKKINVFLEQNGLVPTSEKTKTNAKAKAIPMTENASAGNIGDEVSFSSAKNTTSTKTDTALEAGERQQEVPTYPANMEKRVKSHMKDINEGKEGWYDTAQNIQITIDRINEGSYYVNPQIKDYILNQLEQKLSTFPQEEVTQATNIERRVALQAGRINNQAVIENISKVIQGINDEVQKQYDKAGIITHLGEGINADWLGKESSRKTFEQKMNEVNMRMSKLISLKNQLTTEEFNQKANELLGDILNPEAIVSAFKAGEEANAAMGKMYVIAGTAIAVTGGLAACALVGGGAAAAGAGAAGAATAKTAISVGAIVKGAAMGAASGAVVGGGASIATDTVNKLTNETDNAEDFSAEELTQMAKNAGTAAAMGAAGGAAGGAITGTLMGTTLSTGAKIGVDIAANTVVGAGIDYAATGEVTLEGTLMNATMSGLGAVSAYRGLKGAAQADVPPTRIIGEAIGDPNMNITKVTDYDGAIAAARNAVKDADLKVAVAGYSAAPDGYELKTAAFLNELVGAGDKGKTALITSPTASKGSIDAIATNVAQAKNAPITYLTAEGYVKYINPDEFPTTINTKKFNKIDKFAFQTGAEYSKASADVSNSLIITGGRDVSVLDFKNAIDANNPVVLLRNNDLGGTNFDVNRGRPNNAVAYIEDMIANPTGATNHTKHVEPQWWIDNADKIKRNVKIIDIDSPDAIKETRAFLNDTQLTPDNLAKKLTSLKDKGGTRIYSDGQVENIKKLATKENIPFIEDLIKIKGKDDIPALSASDIRKTLELATKENIPLIKELFNIRNKVNEAIFTDSYFIERNGLKNLIKMTTPENLPIVKELATDSAVPPHMIANILEKATNENLPLIKNAAKICDEKSFGYYAEDIIELSSIATNENMPLLETINKLTRSSQKELFGKDIIKLFNLAQKEKNPFFFELLKARDYRGDLYFIDDIGEIIANSTEAKIPLIRELMKTKYKDKTAISSWHVANLSKIVTPNNLSTLINLINNSTCDSFDNIINLKYRLEKK